MACCTCALSSAWRRLHVCFWLVQEAVVASCDWLEQLLLIYFYQQLAITRNNIQRGGWKVWKSLKTANMLKWAACLRKKHHTMQRRSFVRNALTGTTSLHRFTAETAHLYTVNRISNQVDFDKVFSGNVWKNKHTTTTFLNLLTQVSLFFLSLLSLAELTEIHEDLMTASSNKYDM